MRLEEIILCNFRGYSQEVRIPISSITAFIGKNDAGKTTILEALDTFFNQSKLDPQDKNVFHREEDTVIGCVFSELPVEVVIDNTVSTTLEHEYLLDTRGFLEIRKKYDTAGKETVWIYANHPTNEGFHDLLSKKNNDLKTKIRAQHLEDQVNLTINAEMRHALWAQLGESLTLEMTLINVSQADEKKLWPGIRVFLPAYRLFKSDRTSTDKDNEAQSPISAAMKAALQEQQVVLDRIAEEVREKVTAVANKTVEKLSEFNPSLAGTLSPRFDKDPMWEKAFSFSLTSDNEIPINKRGSGVRRLILLSFFRAAAETDLLDNSRIIYAIEEPETSQHPDAQRDIVNTFIEMVDRGNCQVLLTTHVPGLASLLPLDSLRLVQNDDQTTTVDSSRSDEMITRIAEELGVFPALTPASAEHKEVKLVVCVEGPTDVVFLERASKIVHEEYPDILDLKETDSIITIPLGGSVLQNWVNLNYLKKLNIREFHIYDGDNRHSHAAECAAVIARGDGSMAFETSKNEIENYIHSDLLKQEFGVDIIVDDVMDVSTEITRMRQEANLRLLSPKKVKQRISEHCVPNMTLEMLKERDPDDEVIGWLRDITFTATN